MLHTQPISQIIYLTWYLLNYLHKYTKKDLSCGSFLSDHYTVDFITTIPQDKPKTKSITYRKLKNINPEDMVKDIDAMPDRIQEGDLSDIINSFNSVLKDALNKHVSVITKTPTTRESNPGSHKSEYKRGYLGKWKEHIVDIK